MTLNRMIEGILLEQEAKRVGLDSSPDFIDRLERFKRNIIRDMLLKKYVYGSRDFEPTDGEIKQYYEKNIDQFKKPERVRVRQILLKTREEAEDILSRLKNGEDFSDLVAQFSIDERTKKTGGDMGFFSRDSLRYISEHAFRLKEPGELSTIIASPRGYHILQFIERRPAEEKTLQQAYDKIKQRLKNLKRSRAIAEYIQKLREASEIRINEKLLESE
jgi:peptidyl-prolyl cis-trans isomerase C